MEQVRNEQTLYSAAVYCRLSKDDEQAGESVSIETQKMMLTDFCHEYTLDGTKILRETWDGHTLIPIYDNEDTVCGVVYDTRPYYFQKNLQGDVVAVVNANNDVVARYSYDAWGKCTVTFNASSITNVNPFRYRGYYYDVETGLYYLQSRYYDPEVGRFVNADEAQVSIGIMYDKHTSVDTNMFLYCDNSPLIYVDLYGYRKVKMSVANTLIFGIIGLVVNLVRYGMNLFKVFNGASVNTIQKALLAIAFLLPVEIMTDFVKFHVKHIASMIVTYSRSIIFELATLGLNAAKLSVAGLAISAVCTVASLYLPTFLDSIIMLLYAIKKKCYYWDVKWYGIKYYSK